MAYILLNGQVAISSSEEKHGLKPLLTGLAALLLTGCTGMFPPPSGVYQIPLSEVPAIGAGTVRPVGIEDGHIKVKAQFVGRGPVGTNKYAADVGEWSRFFAERLRDEYSRRGVDVSTGPEITVEMKQYEWAKERFSLIRTRTRSRIVADVRVGNRKWTFDTSTEYDQDGKVNLSSTYSLIREIIGSEEISAVIRGEEDR